MTTKSRNPEYLSSQKLWFNFMSSLIDKDTSDEAIYIPHLFHNHIFNLGLESCSLLSYYMVILRTVNGHYQKGNKNSFTFFFKDAPLLHMYIG
jgi:hypothetical protein